MTSASSPYEQARLGHEYMKRTYGGGLPMFESLGWYDEGGWLIPGPALARNETGEPEPVLTEEQEQAHESE